MPNEDAKDKLIKQLQESNNNLETLLQKERQKYAILQEENIKLKTDLRYTTILGKQVGGTLNDLHNIIHENEQLKTENNKLLEIADQYHNTQINIYKEQAEKAKNEFNLLQDKVREVGKMPAIIQPLYSAFQTMEDMVVDDYDTLQQKLVSQTELNSYQTFVWHLEQGLRLRELATTWRLGIAYATIAYCLINDPAAVSTDILLECRIHGQPTAKTLNRLTYTWISEHLRPNISIATLQDSLRLAQNFLKSGLTQREFIVENTKIKERRLRDAIGWYEIFEQTASELPDGVNTKLQQEFASLGKMENL